MEVILCEWMQKDKIREEILYLSEMWRSLFIKSIWT